MRERNREGGAVPLAEDGKKREMLFICLDEPKEKEGEDANSKKGGRDVKLSPRRGILVGGGGSLKKAKIALDL